MHAFLIISKNNNSVDAKIIDLINKNKSQRIDFEVKKISEVRDLISFTNISSQNLQTIVIKNIHQASREAQNSMLKLIEEPRKNLNFIFTTISQNLILPTIISRSQIINIANINQNFETEIDFTKNFDNLLIGEKFETISKITKREDAIIFLEKLLIGYKHLILENPNYYINLENLLTTHTRILKNANVGLQLTNLVINLK